MCRSIINKIKVILVKCIMQAERLLSVLHCYILYYWIIMIEALQYNWPFNALAGWNWINCNYFIYCWVDKCTVIQQIMFYTLWSCKIWTCTTYVITYSMYFMTPHSYQISRSSNLYIHTHLCNLMQTNTTALP